jgi:hypothetical protein
MRKRKFYKYKRRKQEFDFFNISYSVIVKQILKVDLQTYTDGEDATRRSTKREAGRPIIGRLNLLQGIKVLIKLDLMQFVN